MLDRFKYYNIDYVKGAIIGEALLVDCILVDDNFSNKLKEIDPIVYCKSNYNETYAWKLENIIKYDKPIFCKGQLSLWNYDL